MKLNKVNENVFRVLDEFPHFKKKAPMTVKGKKASERSRCHRMKGLKLGELINIVCHHIGKI